MKNTFKRFISFVLVLVLVMGSVPATVFAGSDSSSSQQSPSRSDASVTTNTYGGNNGHGYFPGVPTREKRNNLASNTADTYVLAISMGRMSNVEIKEIIVSYYTSAQVATGPTFELLDVLQKPFRQVLEVTRLEREAYFKDEDTSLDSVWFKHTKNWPYYGSKYGTYNGLFNTANSNRIDYIDLNEDTVNTYHVKRDWSKYLTVATSLVADVDTTTYLEPKYKAGNVDTRTTVPIESNRTEYIRFVPQYDLGTIESISFVFSKEENGGMSCEFELNDWTLWKIKNGTHPTATNFAYLSNGVGMTFDGEIVCKATPLSNDKTSRAGIVITENGVIRFFNNAFLPLSYDVSIDNFSGAGITRSSYAKYKSDVMGGILELLTFTSAEANARFGAGTFENAINGITSPKLDAYDFVINFADAYGAGLEQFSVSPMSNITVYETGVMNSNSGLLNLSDVLEAIIQYEDNSGKKQTISVPIISNSILNMNLLALETAANASAFLSTGVAAMIRSGDIIQYAQQGDSISFRVEFPNLKKLTAISIKYFDGYAANDDEIGIESIAVYRGFRTKDKGNSASVETVYEQSAVQVISSKANSIIDRLTGGLGINKDGLADILLTQANKLKLLDAIQVASSDSDDSSSWIQQLVRDIAKDGERAFTGDLVTISQEAIGWSSIQSTYRDKAVNEMRLPNDYYTYKCENGVMSALPNSQAYLVYKSDNASTRWIQNGTGESKINLVENSPDTQNSLPIKRECNDLYYIEFHTTNFDIAATNAEALIKFQYRDNAEKDRETVEYNLKDLCKDYMGYQTGIVLEDTRTTKPAIAGNSGSLDNVPLPTDHAIDVSYQYGVQSGHTLGMFLNVSNLNKFTGMNIRIPGSEDDWQIDSVRIVQVTEYSAREVHKTDSNITNVNISEDGTVRFVTNRYYKRIVNGNEIVSEPAIDFLIQSNGNTSTNFETGASTGTTLLREDYSDYQEYMPYNIASSDLKFDTAVQNYEVIVHVGNNSEHATDSDNCGSNNMYYFQLEFTSGKRSAYVLANKQLASDGFRSGFNESFVISTNQDFGDVAGITIIPDDTTSNSDPLDKLCIDQISIIKKNQNCPNKKFVIDNIGWIGTTYKDINDQTTKETRTESELAYSYSVNYSAYEVSLEVCVTYGTQSNQANMAFGGGTEADSQFQGDMTCDITYQTSSGETKISSNIQMVKLMYEYMNRTAPKDSTTEKYQSNTDFMFRENSTDRFLVTIEDCMKIESIVFHATPTETTSINIKDVNIYALMQEGTLAIKAETNGGVYTYYRKYDPGFEAKLVGTLEAGSGNITKTVVVNQQNRMTFYIQGSQFPNFEDERSYDFIVEQVPASNKDTFDIFYFLSDDTPLPSAGNYDFIGGIKYYALNGKMYESIASTKDNDFTVMEIDGKRVLCARGLPAKDLAYIFYIYAEAANDITSLFYVDKAIVQQVRSGVVVDTLDAKFASGRFSQKGGAASSATGTLKDASKAKQVVTLQLGENTVDNKIIATKRDIAVSIIYTTNTLADENKEYTSPFVFASEAGSTEVHAGSILTFNFEEYDVKEIKGIKIQTAGSNADGYIECSVNGINIKNYKNNDIVKLSNEKYDWYSIDKVVQFTTKKNSAVLDITSSMRNSGGADSCMTRVDMVFTTAEQQSVFKTLPATIVYTTNKGNKVVKHVDDLMDYISTDKIPDITKPNTEFTVSLMIPGYQSIYSIQISPDDGLSTSSDGALNIKSLNILKETINGMSSPVSVTTDSAMSFTEETLHTIYPGGKDGVTGVSYE